MLIWFNAPLGSKFFPFRDDPFSEGRQKSLTVASPESVYFPLTEFCEKRFFFFFNLVLVSGVLCVCVCYFCKICTQMYLLKYFLWILFYIFTHTHTHSHTHTHNDYVTQLPQCVKFNTPFNWNNDR